MGGERGGVSTLPSEGKQERQGRLTRLTKQSVLSAPQPVHAPSPTSFSSSGTPIGLDAAVKTLPWRNWTAICTSKPASLVSSAPSCARSASSAGVSAMYVLSGYSASPRRPS